MFICRLTLLLGPPSSGKTTLLLALAGRLGQDLQVCILFLMCIFCSFYRTVGSYIFLFVIRSEVLFNIAHSLIPWFLWRCQGMLHTMDTLLKSLFHRGHLLMLVNKIGMCQRWLWGKHLISQHVVRVLDVNMVSHDLWDIVHAYWSPWWQTISFATDMLEELARREKSAGIKPDEDLDIFMKVSIYLNCLLSDSASVWSSINFLLYILRYTFQLLYCFTGISIRWTGDESNRGVHIKGMFFIDLLSVLLMQLVFGFYSSIISIAYLILITMGHFVHQLGIISWSSYVFLHCHLLRLF